MPKLKNSNATFWVIFKHCVGQVEFYRCQKIYFLYKFGLLKQCEKHSGRVDVKMQLVDVSEKRSKNTLDDEASTLQQTLKHFLLCEAIARVNSNRKGEKINFHYNNSQLYFTLLYFDGKFFSMKENLKNNFRQRFMIKVRKVNLSLNSFLPEFCAPFFKSCINCIFL